MRTQRSTLIAQHPYRVECEDVAVGHAIDEEGTQLGGRQVAPLGTAVVVAVPEHEELLVELLREVVVEALGRVAHGAVALYDA